MRDLQPLTFAITANSQAVSKETWHEDMKVYRGRVYSEGNVAKIVLKMQNISQVKCTDWKQ